MRYGVKVAGLAVFYTLFLSGAGISRQETPPPPQTEPAKKPAGDQMGTWLSRSTKRLGLEEDEIVRRLRRQPNIKWAIRAVARHILD